MPSYIDDAVRAADELIRRLGSVNPATPRVHSGVVFNPRDGIGGVPDAANIDYRGFQAYMTPRSFLDLNPPRDIKHMPIDHIQRAIDAGEPIGTPMLYVDQTPQGWAVRGHEGRGRMTALERMSPDSLFPVAVHPYGVVRARHLQPEDLFKAITPDRRGGASSASVPMAIWRSKPYVQPGVTGDSVLRVLRELLP